MLGNWVINQKILVDLPFSARCVTATVALFVSFEVRTVNALGLDRPLAAIRHWTLIAMVRMVAVIHMAAKIF
jgi:hypothetical protein